MEFSYDDLTEEQKEYFLTHIWNGVGSQNLCIPTPQLIFRGPSIDHDFQYWLGLTEEDRNRADKQFLIDELDRVKHEKHWTQKPFYYVMAYLYYQILKSLGKYSFEYGTEPRDTWEKYVTYFEMKQKEYKQAPRSMPAKLVRKYMSYRR